MEGTPPGDALPLPPQRATPALKGARCGAGAGSPRPHRPHPGHTGCGTPATRSRGRTAGGGTAPDTRRPSKWSQASPAGTPLRQPRSEQRRPARAHAVGPVLDPHARTDRTRDKRVAEPWLPAPEDGRPGEGQRLTPDAPHHGGRPPPPGTALDHPCGTHAPQNMQARGTVLGPHTHTPAPTARGWRTPTARPVGGQSGKGLGWVGSRPHLDLRDHGRRPPLRVNTGPARARLSGRKACRTDDRPRTPRWHTREGDAAVPVCMGRARCLCMWGGSGWGCEARQVTQSGEGEHLTSDAPDNGGRHPPRGRPSATPSASNAGPQGRTLRGRCWIPTPAPTAPGTHGSQNPGCPPQRTGGRGRDSA